jgi:glycosyltransferase involved in cell wall biosynthesis
LQSQQTAHEVEIILVFNGPGAEEIDFEWPGIRILRETKKGPAAARNTGVRAATGDVLAFVDADCTASPDWIESAMTIITKFRSRSLVAGSILRAHPPQNWISLYDTVNFLQQEQYVRHSQAFVTANLFIPRTLFELVGFFDERFEEAACEDWEWATRARRRGIPVMYDGQAAVTHPSFSKFAQLQAKVERLARGELLLKSLNGRDISHPELFDVFRSQLLRAARKSELSALDKLRVMSIGVPVAYWTWRAARSFQRSRMKAQHQLDNKPGIDLMNS